MSQASPYNKAFSALKNIYLEDSWVLGVSEKDNCISFKMEFVLTEEHDEYSPPNSGEQYCYRRGHLHLNGCSEITFEKTMSRPNTDASGEKDFGNIDAFTKISDSIKLEGEWGKLIANCDQIIVEYESGGHRS